MRRVAILVLTALVASLSAVAADHPTITSTWIADVTIVSPERLDQVSVGSVLIENGRIVRVERKPDAKPPSGAKVVSGKGEFLIPGLIDSHVHIAFVPGMMPDQQPAHAQMVREYLQQLPRSYLYYGYTTLIDLAVFDGHAFDDFRHTPLHPDLYDCGEAMPFANGYPMSFFPPAVRFQIFPNFIYDPKQAASIPAQYSPADHTPEADVARIKKLGGICVKTFYERGFGRDKNLPVMSRDTFARIRSSASNLGLVLMIHANSFEAQKFGVDGHVDVLAHGMWHWGELDRQPDVPPEIKALLDEIMRKKIGYQSTIQVLEGELAYFKPDYLKSDAVAKVIPASMLEWFNSPEGKWFKKEIDDDNTPDDTMVKEYEAGPLRRVRQVVHYLAEKNANILFGTDTPSAPTYDNLPGLNGYREMRQLQRAGLSLKQIFQAATINNAREFKLDPVAGTIEPGKIANLVLLKKSPLETIDAYDTITTIWLHGTAIQRDSLAATSRK